MSFTRCLFGTALLLPACIEPAVQGASGASAETTDAATEPAAHDGDPIALEFTSNLDEPIANESWALAKVAVLVK